jgi:hypothetical protein
MQYIDSEDHEDELSDAESMSIVASKLKRPRWSESELSKLYKSFGSHITHKENPTGKQLAEFAKELNFSRSVPTIRTQLNNIMKGKVKCHASY